MFQGAKVSFESIAQPALVDQILCDSKPLKQLQLTSNGKLFNPEFTIKVIGHILILTDYLHTYNYFVFNKIEIIYKKKPSDTDDENLSVIHSVRPVGQ